jgi:hypothetical protein
MRYKRLTGNIYRDYELYAGRCGFFNTFYGDKLTPALQAKARYIWKRLLKLYQYGE